jgi:hypothetical protein
VTKYKKKKRDKERGLVKIMKNEIIRVKKQVKPNGKILSKW